MSSFLLCLFIGLMAPDGATSRSTQHAVLASNVTRNAAYCRTFQTTFGLGSLGKGNYSAPHERMSDNPA